MSQPNKQVKFETTLNTQDLCHVRATMSNFIISMLFEMGCLNVRVGIDTAIPTDQRLEFTGTVRMAVLDYHSVKNLAYVCKSYHTVCQNAEQLSLFSRSLQQSVARIDSQIFHYCDVLAHTFMHLMQSKDCMTALQSNQMSFTLEYSQSRTIYNFRLQYYGDELENLEGRRLMCVLTTGKNVDVVRYVFSYRPWTPERYKRHIAETLVGVMSTWRDVDV